MASNAIFKSKGFILLLALSLGIVVLALPRPEGTKFKIIGDEGQKLLERIAQEFSIISQQEDMTQGYVVETSQSGQLEKPGLYLREKAKGWHGYDYSVTGMLAVAALVLFGVLKWDDISNLEWGTALFIFGGGISLGLAMGYSGAADYFANLFFPLIQGGGWLLLFVGVGVFGALVTNAMANVAAAALILPIVIPMAQLEGVDPTVLALCLGTATSFAMLLVIGCPPNAIAYSFRYFKSSDLTKVGAVATPLLLAILVVVAGVWWKILGLV
jgi:sodium-dependent dicarboxylate transporter 2/3/5